MAICNFKLNHFRNILDASCDFSPSGVNIFCGDNGAGKTSLLEAIYFIGRAKSFRSPTPDRLITEGHSDFSLFAEMTPCENQIIPVGIRRIRQGDTAIRINHADVTTLSALASLFPIRMLDIHAHDLFDAGPQVRRQFLDWGLFYQTDNRIWSQYYRTLKQRNHLLRLSASKAECDSWTRLLAEHGELLDQARRAYLKALSAYIEAIAHNLLGLGNITLEYASGWGVKSDFYSSLLASREEDYRAGFTRLGPHRGDLTICLNGQLAKHFLSRGQQKTLVYAMIVSQGKLLRDQQNVTPIYLVDDLPSELDRQGQARLLNLLFCQPAQVFITSIDDKLMKGLLDQDIYSGKEVRMFHVEHGCVEQVMGGAKLRSENTV